MGNKLLKQKEYLITVEGLSYAGKTTILHKLKLGKVVTRIPTIGLVIESVSFKNYNCNVLNVGGRCPVRPLIRHYHMNSSALIFVVDSSDVHQMADARYELHLTLKEESLQDAVVLILANKQDLPGAANIQEVSKMLEVHNIKQQHCNIVATCATTGEGLHEGLDWLSTTLNNNKQQASLEPTADTAKGPMNYLKKLSERLQKTFLS